MLVPVSRAARVLGLDIGHRHVAAAVANEAAEVLAEVREPADVDQNRETTLELAYSLIRKVAAQAGLAVEDLDAVSACIPSTLTSSTAQQGPVALGAELENHLGRAVTVVNDADAGLLGELRFGSLTGVDDAIYVKVAHGVGAAFQLAGRPYRGSSGLSGEIGHVQPGPATIEPGTAWCRCGNQGCLETAISASSIEDRLGRVQGTPVSAGPGLDTVAQRMLMESGRVLGRTLADLCTALNPAVVVIGGELAARVDRDGRSPLVLGVAESIERFALPAIAAHLQVRTGLLAQRAELLGVLSLALDAAALAQ